MKYQSTMMDASRTAQSEGTLDGEIMAFLRTACSLICTFRLSSSSSTSSSAKTEDDLSFNKVIIIVLDDKGIFYILLVMFWNFSFVREDRSVEHY